MLLLPPPPELDMLWSFLDEASWSSPRPRRAPDAATHGRRIMERLNFILRLWIVISRALNRKIMRTNWFLAFCFWDFHDCGVGLITGTLGEINRTPSSLQRYWEGDVRETSTWYRPRRPRVKIEYKVGGNPVPFFNEFFVGLGMTSYRYRDASFNFL